MKILCTNYEYPPIGGGGSYAARGLAEMLVQMGHQVDCVTSGYKGVPPQECINGVAVHRVSCMRRHRYYTGTLELMTQVVPSYRKAVTLVQSGNYDVNHTHFIIPSGLTAYLVWRRTGLPYVITAHGSDVPGYNPDRFKLAHSLLAPVWRCIIANAAAIISPSHFLREMIQRRLDLPVQVIPNGAHLPEPTLCGQKRRRILVVSRLFERKGVQHFLEAIRDLDTDWEILIAGDGPYLPKLRELATHIRPRIRFLGFVGRPELDAIYQDTAIFVFPSIQENFPVVLLEAMNAGCAIITTNADGCGEVIGDAGITIPTRNPMALRSALDRLMADPGEVAVLCQRGRNRIRQFSWDIVAQSYVNVFEHAVAESDPPAIPGS